MTRYRIYSPRKKGASSRLEGALFRLRFVVAGMASAMIAAACTSASPPPTLPIEPTPEPSGEVRLEDVRTSLEVLAADSMEGRMTATAGAARAARYIAAELRRYGIEPAGDASGSDSLFFQRVPLVRVAQPNGQDRLRLPAEVPSADTLPPARRALDVNVVGVIRGSEPNLRQEAIVVNAHYDHVGIGPAVAGDSLYNGADDNATGVVAVLEVARALAGGPAPRRTVVFLLTTGEEIGLLGTRWYLDNPVIPLERTVATLVIEMVGRSDPLAGGAGRGWLTGYERSTMGQMLAAGGIPIVPDPRPEQNFFLRSDNIAFARRGIPAHTLSSFGLHTDYHRPSDEVQRIDFAHVTGLIDAAVRAVRILADGPAPVWHPGGQP